MVRGTGKFKQKRGGGRQFSRDMELDENGTAVSKDKRFAKGGSDIDEDSDEDSDEESSEEESSEEEAPAAGKAPATKAPEMTRQERREMKKKQGAKGGEGGEEDEDADLINPNHVQKKLAISDIGSTQMSRKEKEAKEKADAKERYWKLHVAGKTDEAKSDMARLAKIRAEREAAQAKRKAEQEAKDAEIESKKKAQLSGKRA